MDLLGNIMGNITLAICFFAWAGAGATKALFYWVATKRFRIERIFGAGGMPSSHTSTVCALMVAIARTEGVSSPLFAMSVVFAVIVMHDAVGVRRAAGEQAKILNKMRFDFTDMKKLFLTMVDADEDDIPEELRDTDSAVTSQKAFGPGGEKLLKELLGHTPIEVLAGAVLGTVIGIFYPI